MIFSDTIRLAEGTVQNTGERSFPVARPRYQRGYIRKRGMNFELRYREDFIDASGGLQRRHRSVVLGAFKNKKEAQRKADVFLRPLNHGAYRPQLDVTLEDFWTLYFEPQILPMLKYSTRQLYRSLTEKHLIPYFGARKLHEITRLEIQRFVTLKRSNGYATKTLEHLRNLLSRLFQTAVDWGMLQENPARGLKLPPRETRRETRVLSGDEIRRLMGTLPEPSRSIFALGIATGLRIGELLGLKVDDVDFASAVLHVRRAVYRGVVGSPKTRRGERSIPLASHVVGLLKDYLRGRKVKSQWLFASTAGTTLNDRNLMRRQVESTCKALDIPRFGWHSLRHTFRTMAGNQGIQPELVQAILGHESLETTMIYMHREDRAEREAVEKLSEVLCPSVPENAGSVTSTTSVIQ
jgi:integrase